MPRYLRVEGPVRNRHIQRKEVNELINGFWQHRLTTQDKMEPVRGGNILTLSPPHPLTLSLSLPLTLFTLSPSHPLLPLPYHYLFPSSLTLSPSPSHLLTFPPSHLSPYHHLFPSLSHPSPSHPLTLSPSHPLTSMYP